MELSDIKGLGSAKQDALRAVGIDSVEKLAAIDLRKNLDVSGITKEGLKDLKAGARRLLAAEGKPVAKAPYSKSGATPKAAAKPKTAAKPKAAAPKKAETAAPAPAKPAAKPAKKGSFFSRLFSRN